MTRKVICTTKALIVVDMVKGFLNKGTKAGPCALYLDGAKDALVPNILRAFDELEEQDIVVYLCDAHARGDLEFQQFPPHCIEGTEESEVIDELPTQEPDDGTVYYRLNKTRFNGFVKTELEGMLAHFEVDEIVIAGVVTELCVAETAKGARQLDYPVTILKGCVWPLNKEDGDRTLAVLWKNYGVRLVDRPVDVTSGGPPAVVKDMNVSPEPPTSAPKETAPPRAGLEK